MNIHPSGYDRSVTFSQLLQINGVSPLAAAHCESRTAMDSPPSFPPSRFTALRRLAGAKPALYARTRNQVNGAVTLLGPYFTHGLITLYEAFEYLRFRHGLTLRDKLPAELAWRSFFHEIWQEHGNRIFEPMHEAPLTARHLRALPADIRVGATGVRVIDASIRQLYETGYLHNHQRLWLASYCIHYRKVDWRLAAGWLYGHLLDGDLASNFLSWQWVAGCFSSKPYLFDAENVLRFAPGLASAGTWIDRPRAELEAIARGRDDIGPEPGLHRGVSEPPLLTRPPGHTRPRDFMPLFSGRRVTLVHPWSLTRPRDASIAIGVIHLPFHTQHPWSRQRWDFVMSRMEEICDAVWIGDLRRLGELAVRCERLAARPTLSDGYREAFAALGTTPLAVTPMLPRPPRPGRSFSAYMKQLRRIAPQLFESVASAPRRTKLQHHGDEHNAP